MWRLRALKAPELRAFVVGHVEQSSEDFVDNYFLSTGPGRIIFVPAFGLSRQGDMRPLVYMWCSKSDVIYAGTYSYSTYLVGNKKGLTEFFLSIVVGPYSDEECRPLHGGRTPKGSGKPSNSPGTPVPVCGMSLCARKK